MFPAVEAPPYPTPRRCLANSAAAKFSRAIFSAICHDAKAVSAFVSAAILILFSFVKASSNDLVFLAVRSCVCIDQVS